MAYIKGDLEVIYTLGKRIKEFRKKKNMTQLQLATMAFISESYMALIESDKRHPSTDVIIKIAEALGVSSDYLLFGDIPKNEMTLFNSWKNLMNGRTPDEIDAAHKLVAFFFKSIDKRKS